SRAALRLSAVDDVAWLDLALADRRLHGRLTADGLQSLRRSYGVAPFEPDVSIWRIRFALNNWDELTSDLRQDVTDEVKAEWAHDKTKIEGLQSEVASPSGRMAISMMAALNAPLESSSRP